MKISAKGRYALASTLYLASQGAPGAFVTVSTIADALQISKIYLEQTFSLLKRGGVVVSVKGAQGGYQLAHPSDQISVLDILSATENALLEQTEETVRESAPDIEITLLEHVYTPLEKTVKQKLEEISVSQLAEQLATYNENASFMFYI